MEQLAKLCRNLKQKEKIAMIWIRSGKIYVRISNCSLLTKSVQADGLGQEAHRNT